MLADLDSLSHRLDPLAKKARGGDREAMALRDMAVRAIALLEAGRPALDMEIGADEETPFRQLQLLTAKPVLYVCNVDEDAAAEGDAHAAEIARWAAERGAPSVVVSAAIEAEIAQLDDGEERRGFLETLGLEDDRARPGGARRVRPPGSDHLLHHRAGRDPRLDDRARYPRPGRGGQDPLGFRARLHRRRDHRLRRLRGHAAERSPRRKPRRCAAKGATTSSATAM